MDEKANGLNGLNGTSNGAVTAGNGPKRRRRKGVAPGTPEHANTVAIEQGRHDPIGDPILGVVTPGPAQPKMERAAPHFERFPTTINIADGESEGDGWEEAESALVYDSESNGRKPMQVLCSDVRMWGGIGEAIMARSKAPITVTLADGKPYEVPPGVTFAILAINELLTTLAMLEANPDAVVEAKIIPTGRRLADDGRWVTHYRVRNRIVKGLSRQDAWRNG